MVLVMSKTFTAEQKKHWINVMQAHQDADRIVQGLLWDGSKGCFFGCAMQEDDVDLTEAAACMRLPAWLVMLAEKIHEGLPKADAIKWPVRLLKAIPIDADISKVMHQLAIKRLAVLADKNPAVSTAINQVIEYHRLELAGDIEARSASWPAESAAWSADSAARSADSSAWSAQSAARSAAR